MPRAAAAVLARAPSRLAMATSRASAASANAGRTRSLILATPRTPQRSLSMIGGPWSVGCSNGDSMYPATATDTTDGSMYPHRIRLRGPWQAEPLDPPGQPRRVTLPARLGECKLGEFRHVRFRRRFGRPRLLDAQEHVWR